MKCFLHKSSEILDFCYNDVAHSTKVSIATRSGHSLFWELFFSEQLISLLYLFPLVCKSQNLHYKSFQGLFFECSLLNINRQYCVSFIEEGGIFEYRAHEVFYLVTKDILLCFIHFLTVMTNACIQIETSSKNIYKKGHSVDFEWHQPPLFS